MQGYPQKMRLSDTTVRNLYCLYPDIHDYQQYLQNISSLMPNHKMSQFKTIQSRRLTLILGLSKILVSTVIKRNL